MWIKEKKKGVCRRSGDEDMCVCTHTYIYVKSRGLLVVVCMSPYDDACICAQNYKRHSMRGKAIKRKLWETGKRDQDEDLDLALSKQRTI